MAGFTVHAVNGYACLVIGGRGYMITRLQRAAYAMLAAKQGCELIPLVNPFDRGVQIMIDACGIRHQSHASVSQDFIRFRQPIQAAQHMFSHMIPFLRAPVRSIDRGILISVDG
jgi:hypothetical protein